MKRLRYAVLLAIAAFAVVFAVRFDLITGLGEGSFLNRCSAFGEPSHRLSRMRVISSVILHVKRAYVEPSRVSAKKMFRRSLRYLQRAVPEIMATWPKGSRRVVVKVHDQSRTFSVGTLDDPHKVVLYLQPIFKFIEKSYKGEVKLRDIEYAAIAGVLSTLDPHSLHLPPLAMREMTIGTGGKFGGLGIVISIRNNQLTVISPIPDTPADRVGLRAQDRIVRINDESTVNMRLTDAVKRLRGLPGTKVAVWIRRKGVSRPLKYTIVRQMIVIRSVTSRLLPGKVGYVRLRSFQSNTTTHLRAHLARLRARSNGLAGLILDLRNNPGGLLRQAVSVSNVFLKKGVIVTHSSGGINRREVKRATEPNTEPMYPMVVLVNAGSASASEIVASALRDNGRAVVAGRRTYGKGTVQILFRLRDSSGLKLTVAQYLTPRDVSIQEVGITPDLETLPVHLEKSTVIFHGSRRPTRRVRPGDGPQKISNSTATRRGRSLHKVWYYDKTSLKEKIKRAQESDYARKKARIDFEMSFASALVRSSRSWRRARMLKAAGRVVVRARKRQGRTIGRVLAKAGVNWSVGPVKGKPRLVASARVKGPTGQVAWPGKKVTLEVTLKNKGSHPAYRVYALTKSDYWLFDNRELIFGRVPAGGKKRWRAVFEVPKAQRARFEPIEIRFFAVGGRVPKPLKIVLETREEPRPKYAFAYFLEERRKKGGGGAAADGLVQPGESYRVWVVVKNTGPGPSPKCHVTLSNRSGRRVFISKGRVELKKLRPGQTGAGYFDVTVRESVGKKVSLQITVMDDNLGAVAVKRLEIPVVRKAGVAKRVRRRVKVTSRWAWLRSGPMDSSPAVVRLARGTRLRVVSSMDGYYRVLVRGSKLGIGGKHRRRRFRLWVRQGRVGRGSGGSRPRRKPRLRFTSPLVKLNLKGVPVRTGVRTLLVRGQVTDDGPIRDVQILRNGRKVHFKPYGRKGDRKISFEVPVRLERGNNRITVVAREGRVFAGYATVVVLYEPGGAKSTVRGGKPISPLKKE